MHMSKSAVAAFVIAALVCAFVQSGEAAFCTGSPPMYKGLPCASTTRYEDTTAGACGCGSSGAEAPWYATTYTAAASQLIFDPANASDSWCGSGCGSCYEITPTGDCPGNTGANAECATSTSPIVIMVTNQCPYVGNTNWCPLPNTLNLYGYGQHFDLWDQNLAGKITALGWNNPAVTYQRVSCGTGILGSPTCADATGCTGCPANAAACAVTGSTSAPTSTPPKATSTAAPTATSTSKTTPTAASTPKTTPAAASTPKSTATAATTPAPTGHAIFTSGAFSSVWSDWSAPLATHNTSAYHSAPYSLGYTANAWNQIYIHNSAAITGVTEFTFWIYYTSTSQPLQVLLYLGTASSPTGNPVALGTPSQAHTWIQETVKLSSWGETTSASVGGFAIQAATASSAGPYLVDDIYWS